MSHAWVMPTGEPIVMEAALASMLMQPVSIVLTVVVVTPGTVPVLAAAPLAVLAATSIGVTASTPEYRTMPAPFATAELRVH